MQRNKNINTNKNITSRIIKVQNTHYVERFPVQLLSSQFNFYPETRILTTRYRFQPIPPLLESRPRLITTGT
ncbi:hypothetical protein EUGRSUZ_L02900 [Eucalyptus grandis]|uniref:Uncharacterized protein n=1 Tax=Eucalyptus grandis TaxID=71139 RepID=A0AAD9WIN6_EUCGR|nr:hypothetical protein EUGRSUZ_L02900 [Eucalyptus grandis]